jgi:hypothetical protein
MVILDPVWVFVMYHPLWDLGVLHATQVWYWWAALAQKRGGGPPVW